MDAAHRRLLWLLGLAIFFEGYGRNLINVTLPYLVMVSPPRHSSSPGAC